RTQCSSWRTNLESACRCHSRLRRAILQLSGDQGIQAVVPPRVGPALPRKSRRSSAAGHSRKYCVAHLGRSARSHSEVTMRNGKLAFTLIVVATIVRLALGAFIPLLPDETYYWEWSRHIAAGYFDHPPAVAILIRSGTALFGQTALGVRLGAILAGAVASIAVVVMSWRLAAEPDRADEYGNSDATNTSGRALGDPGVRAALLMLVIPGALIGFVLATPDAPLLAAIALTLAALERAIASRAKSAAAFGWWCAAGVMLGVAFCSKFTSVLIPAGVLVALLSRRSLRKRLTEAGPYVATLLALAVLAPTLVWNSHNGWISFVFQLHHGFTQAHGSILGREIGLIGGQLGIISPIIAVMAAFAVARGLRR